MGSSDVALDGSALDDDHADLDVGFHLGAVADDERVIPPDLTAKAAVDAQPPLEMELALEMGASSEKCGDFGRGEGLGHGEGC